jgi:predicted helicase
MDDILYKVFIKCSETKHNLFNTFLETCQEWYERPAHTLTEMRIRENTKVKGDIFELFSVLYLTQINNNVNVWLLKDVPDNILNKLSLKRRDMGIDIVIEDNNGDFLAVQCKYKKHVSHKKNVLTWKSLSTFYALCLRTGPWKKYIIITNCDYTLHQGKKTKKDISICLKSLQNITNEQWLKMCNVVGESLTSNDVSRVDTLEELRTKRLAYFS